MFERALQLIQADLLTYRTQLSDSQKRLMDLVSNKVTVSELNQAEAEDLVKEIQLLIPKVEVLIKGLISDCNVLNSKITDKLRPEAERRGPSTPAENQLNTAITALEDQKRDRDELRDFIPHFEGLRLQIQEHIAILQKANLAMNQRTVVDATADSLKQLLLDRVTQPEFSNKVGLGLEWQEVVENVNGYNLARANGLEVECARLGRMNEENFGTIQSLRAKLRSLAQPAAASGSTPQNLGSGRASSRSGVSNGSCLKAYYCNAIEQRYLQVYHIERDTTGYKRAQKLISELDSALTQEHPLAEMLNLLYPGNPLPPRDPDPIVRINDCISLFIQNRDVPTSLSSHQFFEEKSTRLVAVMRNAYENRPYQPAIVAAAAVEMPEISNAPGV